ncbi:MAG: glycosyltransferase family 1 protein [Deltaproteobacteria bacterium]|nr:glycosyltransferase family 1 protein [Deltaproteobacteria bacterium]
MKILYLSDRYAWDMYGVKRSLYESLLQTVPVDFVDYQEYHPEVRFEADARPLAPGKLFQLAMEGDHTHIFFASSCLAFEPEYMERLRKLKTLVGFGFSDPRFVENTRRHWRYFHAYFSLSDSIADEAATLGIPGGVMLPSIHPGFHDTCPADHRNSEYDAIFFGNISNHPDAPLRRTEIKRIRDMGLSVLTVGHGGDIGHLEGKKALSVMSKARIGINVMGPASTLPHRIFEYSAANLCVLTTVTKEISACFDPGSELLSINHPELSAVLFDKNLCREVAERGRARCLKDHTIGRRVETILSVLRQLAL